MLVALLEVFGIGFVALGIALLDATSRGGMVAGDGQSDRRSVLEIKGYLHESLAEGATSDDECSVLVLHSPSEDLAGAGTKLID